MKYANEGDSGEGWGTSPRCREERLGSELRLVRLGEDRTSGDGRAGHAAITDFPLYFARDVASFFFIYFFIYLFILLF